MGNESSTQQGELTFSPAIISPHSGRKYQPHSLLGAGAFGFVLKVQDVETKKFYALKCARRESKKYGEVNDSCEREMKILKKIKKHENIVEFVEFFQLQSPPIKLENMKMKDTTGTFDCVILEYCTGTDLSSFLDINKIKEDIPFTYKIKWFIIILKAMAHIHKANIVHRDMKPDNILVVVNPDKKDDFEKVELKISDFGSAQIIKKKEKIDGRRGCHMFYSSPELVLQGKGDQLSDIWALGLVFFQVISRITVKEFEKLVRNVFKILMITPKTQKQVMKKFKLKKTEDAKSVHLMRWAQKKNLIYKDIVLLCVKDPSVKNILSKMICSKKKRKSASQLLKDPIVHSWDILTQRKKELYKSVHHEAVISFLNKKELVNECLEVLNSYFDYSEFVEDGGIEVLFNAMETNHMLNYSKIFCRIMAVNPESIHKFTILFRYKEYMEMYEKTLLTFDDRFSYLFIYNIFNGSRTVAKRMMPLLSKLFEKANSFNSCYILAIVEVLIPHVPASTLTKFFTFYKKSEVLFLKKINFRDFSQASSTHVCMYLLQLFSKIKKHLEANHLVEEYLIMIFSYLKNYFKGEYIENTTKTTTHKMGHKNSCQFSPDLSLKHLYNDRNKSRLIKATKKNDFNCIESSSASDTTRVEFITTEAIGFFEVEEDSPVEEEFLEEIPVDSDDGFETEEEEPLEEIPVVLSEEIVQGPVIWDGDIPTNEEFVEDVEEETEECLDFPDQMEEPDQRVAIMYYELDIKEGGMNDDIGFGFYLNNGEKGSKIFFRCKNRTISYCVEKKDDDKLLHKKQLSVSIVAETDDHIGAGVTRNGFFFITKNGKLIQESFTQIPELKGSINFSGYYSIWGNEGFEAKLNLGKEIWSFSFINKKIKEEKRDLNDKKYDTAMVKKLISNEFLMELKEKHNNNPEVYFLIEEIIKLYNDKVDEKKKKIRSFTKEEREYKDKLREFIERESYFKKNLENVIKQIKESPLEMKRFLHEMEREYTINALDIDRKTPTIVSGPSTTKSVKDKKKVSSIFGVRKKRSSGIYKNSSDEKKKRKEEKRKEER